MPLKEHRVTLSILRQERLPELWPISVLMLAAVAHAGCYPTPEAAIGGLQSARSAMPAAEQGGYRVVSMLSDPLLRRSWATIASCDHPEWPARIVPVSPLSAQSTIQLARLQPGGPSSPIVIHAGDPVRLWWQETFVRLQVAGISEQNGSVGQTVRVRLAAARDAGSAQPEERSGAVRGPSDVEMRP